VDEEEFDRVMPVWLSEQERAYNADSGELGADPAPATDLLVGLTLPQEPYRDSPQQQMDDFYQHLDHIV
jgi:hypothetical protein